MLRYFLEVIVARLCETRLSTPGWTVTQQTGTTDFNHLTSVCTHPPDPPYYTQVFLFVFETSPIE